MEQTMRSEYNILAEVQDTLSFAPEVYIVTPRSEAYSRAFRAVVIQQEIS